jgi:hypothetical protein
MGRPMTGRLAAAVQLAVALGPSALAEPPPDNSIRISAPPRFVLGEDKRAKIEFQLPGARDPKTPLRTATNAGSVSDLSDSGTTFVGAFVPPETFFPQAAIIAAVARAGGTTAFGWRVLPLVGIGNLAVKVLPRAKASLKIGSDTFGPVRADRTGKATIRVKVPPGYTEAVVLPSGRKIPLGAAPFTRLVAIAADETLPADGASTTAIRAFVVDKFGHPDPTARVYFAPERGSTGPVTAGAAGEYLTEYTAPSTVGNGGDVIVYGVVGDETARAKLTLHFVTGTPRNLQVWVDPPSYTAGGQPPMVMAQVKDAAGNPINANVEPSAEVGTFGVPRSAGLGLYAIPFAPPETFAGRKALKISVMARTVGGQPARSEATLALKPGKAVRLDVNADLNKATADGSTPVPIAVRAFDAHGNLVSDVPVSGKTDEGSVRPPQELPDGTYRVAYVPPLAFEARRVNVEIDGADGLTAQVPVDLSPARRTVAFGLKAGYTSNFVALNSPTAGIEVNFRLPVLGSRVFVVLDATADFANAKGAADTSLVTVPVAAELRYQFPAFAPDIVVYLDAGPVVDLAFAKASVAGGDQPPASETLAVLGGQAHLGVGYQFGRSYLALELKYLYASAKGTVLAGVGDRSEQIGGAAAVLKYVFEL